MQKDMVSTLLVITHASTKHVPTMPKHAPVYQNVYHNVVRLLVANEHASDGTLVGPPLTCKLGTVKCIHSSTTQKNLRWDELTLEDQGPYEVQQKVLEPPRFLRIASNSHQDGTVPPRGSTRLQLVVMRTVCCRPRKKYV